MKQDEKPHLRNELKIAQGMYRHREKLRRNSLKIPGKLPTSSYLDTSF